MTDIPPVQPPALSRVQAMNKAKEKNDRALQFDAALARLATSASFSWSDNATGVAFAKSEMPEKAIKLMVEFFTVLRDDALALSNKFIAEALEAEKLQ